MGQLTGTLLVQVWLVVCESPSHCLNQGWVIINLNFRNKQLRSNLNQNKKILITKNTFETVCKMAVIFCSALKINVFARFGTDIAPYRNRRCILMISHELWSWRYHLHGRMILSRSHSICQVNVTIVTVTDSQIMTCRPCLVVYSLSYYENRIEPNDQSPS